MLASLGFVWMMLTIGCVGIVSYILSMGLDAIMGRESLGPVANAVVLTGGFFIAIELASGWGFNLADMRYATTAGLGGAFVSLTFCAFAKGLLSRW
jgi:hypothetical protein